MDDKVYDVLSVNHLDHLSCIMPEDCNVPKKGAEMFRKVCGKPDKMYYVIGPMIGTDPPPLEECITAVGRTEGIPVVFVADNKDEEPNILSFYPIGIPLESVEPLTERIDLSECDNKIDAYGSIACGQYITCFLVGYPRIILNKDFDPRKSYPIDLIGYAYNCKAVYDDSQGDTQASGISESFIQRNFKYPDEFSFCSRVYDLDEIEVFGVPMYRIKVLLGKSASMDGANKFMTLYAKRIFFEGPLKKGDLLHGTGWLQGYVRGF